MRSISASIVGANTAGRFLYASLLIGVLIIGAAPSARAVTVTYTFTGMNTAAGGDGLPVAFSFSSQGFITSSTSLLASQLSSCTNCLVSTVVPAVVFQPANANWDTIDFGDTMGTGSAYAFFLGSFAAPGTYPSLAPFNPGTLTVSVAGLQTVSYTFSGANTAAGGDGLPVAFSFSSQGFITSSTSLLASQLSSCTNCLVSTQVPAVVFEPANASWDTVQFDDIGGGGTEYAFPLGSLAAPGTYTSVAPFNPGTLTVSVAGPPTIHVPGDQPTIQAGINAANNGDTVLVAPGTYVENINFQGKAITVTSANGPSTTIIDGGLAGTVVTFNTNEGSGSVLSGFTVRNGRSSYNAGGIQITNASPTITGNIITGNQAPVGLGIFINGGSPLIKNNTITGNNTQYGDGGEGGGGILAAAPDDAPSFSPLIIGNVITNNSVALGGDGGGISVEYFSSPTIQGNLISGNTAYNDGGGVTVRNHGGAVIIQNVIVKNASLGGGSGAGLYVSTSQGSTLMIEDNTIAANSAGDNTSGIYITGFQQLVTFTNNIVVASDGQNAITCDATYSSVPAVFSYNDVFSLSGMAWSGPCSTANSGNISADPLFVNAAAGNFHLQPGSPAIDAGSNSVPQLPSTDFDGNPRIFNSIVDLGAYEYQGFTTAGLSLPSLSFSPQLVGSGGSALTEVVTNSGATALQISAITTSGNFSETDTCLTATGIPVGQSCQINVVFLPLLPGPLSGQLTIVSNASTSPQSVSLSGNGTSTPAVVSTNPGTLRDDFSGWVGMKISTGNSFLSITALGRICVSGNNGSHMVKIVDASTGKDLPGASVTVSMAGGTAGSFVYADLPAAVILSPDTAYYIVSQETAGGDQWYDINTMIQTTLDWSDVSGVWSGNGTAYNLFGSRGQSYVPVSFLYNIGIVPSLPAITRQPQGATIGVDGTATFTVGASGGNLSYQWWSAPQGSSTFTAISGATSSSYTIPPAVYANNGTQFQCVVSNILGSATSNPAVLTVLDYYLANYVTSANLGTLRNDFSGWVGMSVSVGNSPVIVTALGREFVAGNSGSHTVKVVNANGQDVAGASATLSMSGGVPGSFVYGNLPSAVTLNANTTYYIVSQETQGGDQWYDINTTIQTMNVANETTGVWSSDGSTYNLYGSADHSYVPIDFVYALSPVTSEPPPVVTQQPQNATIVIGAAASFTVGASGDHLTYQWLSAPSGSSVFSPIPGATASSYTTPLEALGANGTQFECVVMNHSGSETSSAATLAVQFGTPYVIADSLELGTLRNDFTGWVGMSVTVGSTPLTVTALGRWNVAGSNGTHTVKIVSANGQDVIGGSVSIATAGASGPGFFLQPLAAGVTLNANTTYYIVSQEVQGGDHWYDTNTTIQTTNAANETTGVWSPDGVTYNLYGSADESYGPVSFTYVVGSVAAPQIAQQPQNATTVAGGTASFAVGASGGSLTYQWWSALPGGSNFTAISGATSSSYTTSAAVIGDGGTQFMCVVTNNLGSANSTAATLTVLPNTATNYVTSTTLGTLRNNFSGWAGMAISIGGSAISVTQLGRMVAPGNTGVHELKLVTASGADVAGSLTSVNTSGAQSGSFLYSVLNSPVTLQANTTYYIASQETAGGDQWYDVNTSVQTTTSASETSGVWSPDGATYNLYGSANHAYVPVDFQYTELTASASFVTAITPGPVRNDFTGWVGATITTGASGVQVTQLGRYFLTGNTGTHIVKLVNASTGNDVSGGAVSVNLAGGQPGGFVYGTLASPVNLNPNTVYYIVSQETQGGDQWYDLGTTVQTTNVATGTASVWSPDGATYNQIGAANHMYVPLSFTYPLTGSME